MIVGIPKETYPGEKRVALVPALLSKLKEFDVLIEKDAGLAAGFPDDYYIQKGAEIADREDVFQKSDVILQVRSFGANPDESTNDLELLHPGQVLIGMMNPFGNLLEIEKIAARGVTAFALELIPRIARAQSMDVLSSMAMISGYKAVIIAANHISRLFPLMMTAAGTVLPVRVLVIGTGVAGLQAISTARRLGAVVSAYDIRPAAKEQVESLGAKFIELVMETADTETAGGYARSMDEVFYQRQQELMKKIVSESDVVITTAAIFGGKAPLLVTEEMVRSMAAGSVIVDLVAEQGGNCELTQSCTIVTEHDVKIIAPDNIASSVSYHASQMYASNVVNFLLNLFKSGKTPIGEFASEDEIVRQTMIIRDGEILMKKEKIKEK